MHVCRASTSFLKRSSEVSELYKACSKKDRIFAIKTLLLILQHFKHCPLQSSPLCWRYTVSKRFFHYWNASWNALSVMARSSLIAFSWISSLSLIRRTACARAQFSGCSSTTNHHIETGQRAVCCQNLTLGALSSRSALSVRVGALFKKFGLFLNNPRT
jgi:hypothetical protein